MRLLCSRVAQFIVQARLWMQANTHCFTRKVVYADDDTTRSTPIFRAPSSDLDLKEIIK